MNLCPNGIIIQEIRRPTNFATNFNYYGVNAYHHNPLLGVFDADCKKISDEASFLINSDGSYTPLEFISNIPLALKYIQQCHVMDITIRALFVESEYTDEKWRGSLPKLNFIGYEYTPIPFDSQILTDFSWYEPLHVFFPQLNCNGLFDSIGDVLKFKNAYDVAVVNHDIGDDVEAYICKISEIII